MIKWLEKVVLEVLGSMNRGKSITLGLTGLQPTDQSRLKTLTSTRPWVPVHQAHPANVSGPFYSENGGCIVCEAPLVAAPRLMGWHSDWTGDHCIFIRQPETSKEVAEAIHAMSCSCVANLRYRGTDRKILRRLRRLGMSHLCDALEDD